MKSNILMLFFIVFLMSCANDDEWYPEGSVEVINLNHEEVDGSLYGTITLKVSNTGLSKISTVTSTVQIQSDKRVYWKTIVNEITILPDEYITADFDIGYVDIDELVTIEDIKVTNAFFE